jgi:cysteinyl-tRNA synthetase
MNIGAAENWQNYWKPDCKLGNPKWLNKKYKGYDDEIYVKF